MTTIELIRKDHANLKPVGDRHPVIVVTRGERVTTGVQYWTEPMIQTAQHPNTDRSVSILIEPL